MRISTITVKILMLIIPSLVRANFLPRSFSASFEQVYLSSLTKKEKKSWGNLSYKFPGNIKFEVQKPKKILFISNKKKSWIYRPPFIEGEKGELTIKNTSRTGLAALLDSLQLGLTNNAYYKVNKNNKIVSLVFNIESEKKFGIKKGRLIFKTTNYSFKNLVELKITYPDKRKVSFKLSKLELDKNFKKNFFTFLPPKNTNIGY